MVVEIVKEVLTRMTHTHARLICEVCNSMHTRTHKNTNEELEKNLFTDEQIVTRRQFQSYKT